MTVGRSNEGARARAGGLRAGTAPRGAGGCHGGRGLQKLPDSLQEWLHLLAE